VSVDAEENGPVYSDRMSGQHVAPIMAAQRIATLDIVRAIALLGIVIANVNAFAQPALAYYWPPALLEAGPGRGNNGDAWFWLAQFALVDGKARALFAMLFGAGLVLFAERAAQNAGAGAAPELRQVRRLIWLAAFGLLHFYLLFEGDILFSYATAGFVALAMLGMPGRSLLVMGLAWAVAGALLRISDFAPAALAEAGGGLDAGGPQIEPLRIWWRGQLADAALQAQVFSQGSYADVLAWRWTEESGRLVWAVVLNFYETIPLIMIGMGLYKMGLFSGALAGRRAIVLAWVGVALGLALNLAAGWHVMRGGFQPFATQLSFFGLSMLFNLPFVTGAMVLLARWAAEVQDGWLSDRLAAMGRMAFTNYIGTSLVLMLVFNGWAGGLFGTLDRVEMIPVIALVWAMMLTGSRLWLGRYAQGPLEWLWRCLTYWRVLPLRR